MENSQLQLTEPTLQLKSNAFLGTEGTYLLPHHVKEIDRLQRQHYFMKSTTDGALLVTPLPSEGKTLRVLDSGCADGTWLLDLKHQHQDQRWELYGVDIGSSLFPLKTSGLDLRQHNIKEPFPSSWGWHEYFDIIHQRLLVWGLEESVWSVVLRNQLDILKPAGWIQLVEVEWIDPKNPHSLPELYKCSLMQEWSTKSFGMDINIAYKLEALLESAGFTNIQKVQFRHGYGPLAHSLIQKDASVELYVECFRSLDAKMPPDGIPGVAKTPQEFHNFLDRLELEIKEFGFQPKLDFVFAQKASNEKIAHQQ